MKNKIELEKIDMLTDSETDIFKSCIKTLLSSSFIIRGYKNNDRLYTFAVRNFDLLESWFSYADIDLKKDEALGVIAIRSGADMRIRLSRDETCALIIIRIMYEEKRNEISLSQFPSILIFDFLQKFKAVTSLELKKTRLKEILKKLSAFSLIEIEGDPFESEAVIILYPSILFTIDSFMIDEVLGGIEAEAKKGRAKSDD
ncbi:MAG TPA: DUF4194 domain-containing protein [Treponemataceae bacterium]|nr:DUF4194 domain-containing protein [Treponemataceae bacterium]HOS30062.1 DUF4194 domain-containing protein [Treponemataceae bacterium]HQL04408.1 DUF4194 domain-containing protein [Treponemataceae bacterium]